MKKTYSLFLILFVFAQAMANDVELDECDAYISKFNYIEAIECIQQNQNEVDGRKKLLFCYQKTKQYSQAINLLKELISEDADNIQLMTDLAETYQAEGNFDSSLACYNQLYSRDTTNVYFHLKQAELLSATENYLASINLYKKIYEQNNQITSCLNNIANNYKMINQTDSAIVYFKKALRDNDKDWMSTLNLMTTYINNEAYDEAISIGSNYMKNDSTNKKINLFHAYALYKNEDYPEAIAGFKTSLAQGDSSLIVNRSLGSSYFKIALDSLAYHYLNIAAEQDSTNNNVLYQLGIVSRDLGKNDQAIHHFTTILDRTLPQGVLMYHYCKELSEIYFDEMNFEESLKYAILSEPYANTSQKVKLYFKIADLYQYYLKDSEKSMKYYRKYVEATKKYFEENKENLSEEEIKNIEDVIKWYGL